MTARDWFIVGARLIGVWVLYEAVGQVAAFFTVQLEYRREPEGTFASSYMVFAIAFTALALYLLFGTHHLASLCFGDEAQAKDATPAPPETSDKPDQPAP